MESFWAGCLKYLSQVSPRYVIDAIIYLFLAYIISILWALYCGHETEIVWGLAKFRPSGKIRTIQQAFSDLKVEYNTILSVAQQKSNMIKLLGTINREIERLIQPTLSQEEFDKLFNKVLDYILPGILSIFTNNADNILRVAIFCNQGGYLKIFKGYGYSTDGQDNLKFELNNSTVAGYVFLENKSYYSKDVHDNDPFWEPHPKAHHVYHSLYCTPIGTAHKTWGVLNIDASRINSFSEDDRDYLKYIAQALSVMFEIKDLIEHRGNITIKGGGLTDEQIKKREGGKAVS
jgi:transcriptional regulator with GAF, ATPase, and Fis domain